MSTLANISSAAAVLPEEQGANNLPDTQGDIAGLFEEIMAHALSPSSGNATASSGQVAPGQSSHVNKQSNALNFQEKSKTASEPLGTVALNTPAQSSSIEFNPKTSDKTQTKPTESSTHTDKSSTTQTDASTSSNPLATTEITVNQILAAAMAIANAPEKINPAVTPTVTREAVSASSTILPVALPSGKQASVAQTYTAASKVSASSIPGSSNNLTTGMASTAKALSTAATKTEPLAKSLQPIVAAEAKPTSVSTVASADRIPSQTASAFQEANFQKLNPTSAKATAIQVHQPSISSPVDTGIAASQNTKSVVTSQSHESDSDAKISPSSQPDSNGTSIAKQDTAVKQAENTNKFAGQNEKVLPGGAVSSAKTSALSASSANNEQTTASAMANISTPGSTSSVSATDSVAIPAVTDTRTTTLERTQEMVSLNAVRLSDSGNNSMQVVIKPDAGTQLSLQLKQQDGQVQVQAALQQGNFSQLSQQWPDLQQQLEQRGIQLAPLTDNGSFVDSNGSETFQNKQNQTSDAGQEVTYADMPTSMQVPEMTPKSTYKGWETWA